MAVRFGSKQCAKNIQYQGKQARVVGIRDLTQTKQAEAARRHSEIGFALAAEGASNGIWDWDLITGKAYLSPRWKHMLGYTDDELPNHGSAWEDSLHPDDAERVQAYLKAYLDRQIPTYQVEFRARHKDGSYRFGFKPVELRSGTKLANPTAWLVPTLTSPPGNNKKKPYS